jgi:hypothetical protein
MPYCGQTFLVPHLEYENIFIKVLFTGCAYCVIYCDEHYFHYLLLTENE